MLLNFSPLGRPWRTVYFFQRPVPSPLALNSLCWVQPYWPRRFGNGKHLKVRWRSWLDCKKTHCHYWNWFIAFKKPKKTVSSIPEIFIVPSYELTRLASWLGRWFSTRGMWHWWTCSFPARYPDQMKNLGSLEREAQLHIYSINPSVTG